MLIDRMVRGDAAFQMKVASVRDGVAECVSIDGDGRVHVHHISASHLRLISDVLDTGRAWWPELNHVDEVAIIEEELRHKAAEKERKRKAKKSKPSKKLKRKAA